MGTVDEPMTVEECWEHLGSRGVGRIGFDAGNGPRIHPMDYTVDGSEVHVLTSESSELARFTLLFAAGGLVTFEVDQLDATRGECWSVLLTAQVVDAGHRGPGEPVPAPTSVGARDWWVRLRPRQVTGRRLVTEKGAGGVQS